MKCGKEMQRKIVSEATGSFECWGRKEKKKESYDGVDEDFYMHSMRFGVSDEN